LVLCLSLGLALALPALAADGRRAQRVHFKPGTSGATVKGFGDRLGSHVFVLKGIDEGSRGLSWQAIGHHEQAGLSLFGHSGSEESVMSRLQADTAFQGALRKRMHPGMVMVVTDNPLHPDRRSGEDFVIMDSA
jgi:hypothetical protein